MNPTSSSPSQPTSGRPVRFTYLIMMVASGTILMPWNTSMLALALPQMMADFDVGVSTASWLMTIYYIGGAAVLIIGGRLGDMYGQQRIFNIGIVSFGVVSLICAMAPNFPTLLAGRCFQGFAGSLILPNGFAILRAHTKQHQRGRAFGFLTAANATAASVAPALGGFLVQLFNWQAVFLLNVVFIVVCLAIEVFLVGRLVTPGDPGTRFDNLGSVLLAAFSASLALAISIRGGGWLPDSLPVWLFGSSLVCFMLFVFHEFRTNDPLVRLELFRIRNFFAATFSSGFFNITMFGFYLLTPLMLQDVMGHSPLYAGVLLLMFSGTMALAAPLGGAVSDRMGRRFIPVLGLSVLTVSTAFFLNMNASSSLTFILVAFFGIGLGAGMVYPVLQAASLEAAPPEFSGVASGVYLTGRYLGGSIGTSIISGAAFGVSRATLMPAFHTAIIYLLLFAVASLIMASLLRPRFDNAEWQAVRSGGIST